MKKLYILLAFFITLQEISAVGHITFETLFLPDSNHLSGISGNQAGELFVSAISTAHIRNDKILKSTDHGQTWDTIFDFGQIQARNVCINDVGEIYTVAAWNSTNETLFKSTDNGLNWAGYVIPTNNSTSNSSLFVTGADSIYVAQYSGSGTLILRSVTDGLTWDTLFIRIGQDYSSEVIGGLAVGNNGVYYVGVFGYFDGQGGVFRTLDNGETWELFGLGGNYVTDLEFNSNGDLFITTLGGEYSGGLYAVFANENVITPILTGPSLSSLVINSNDEIFATNFWAGYLYHSSDNGQTYEWITAGLPNAGLMNLFIDQQQFLYTKTEGVGKRFWGSVEPTVISAHFLELPNPIVVFPNPCNELLMGIVPAILNEKVGYRIYSNNDSFSKTGQVIVNNGRFVVDVSDLSRGLYLLVLLTDEPFSGKFLIN